MRPCNYPFRDLDGRVYFGLREARQVRLEGPGTLQVLRGRAWITIVGQPRDWFVGRSNQFELLAGQQLFVQGDPRCVVAWRKTAPAVSRFLQGLGFKMFRQFGWRLSSQ